MNKYKLIFKSTDAMGLKFLENVVEYAKKGATLDFKYPASIRFPHTVMMDYQTEDYLVTSPEIQVWTIDLEYTKEMLDGLEWSDFKNLLKKYDIGGRDRAQMTKQYLKMLEEQKVS